MWGLMVVILPQNTPIPLHFTGAVFQRTFTRSDIHPKVKTVDIQAFVRIKRSADRPGIMSCMIDSFVFEIACLQYSDKPLPLLETVIGFKRCAYGYSEEHHK
jgi:hypothetical protein